MISERGLQLREQFLASFDSDDADARARLRAAFEGFDPPPVTSLQGLSLSPVPSLRFCMLRLLAAELLDAPVRSLFARPRAQLPELAAVFIDPLELAYHSFEHIIGLEHVLGKVSAKQLRIEKFQPLAKGVWTSAASFDASLQARLLELDGLDIYLPPINPALRGGKRGIFHCTQLAKSIEAKLLAALPKPLRDGFAHVNPVFRLNRFEPGDARFHEHVDAPFHDPRQNLISKYTLLVYLTGGSGDAVLRFRGGPQLDRIEANTLVLFDQALAHEGGPFMTGSKLFLRTELIYTAPQLARDPRIGALFAKAIYLDGQSLFAPELAQWAAAAHDRAAAAHWRGLAHAPTSEPLLLKRFGEIRFATNGFDYWFRAGRLPLVDCAALCVLDALNARLGGEAFARRCDATAVLEQQPSEAELAWLDETASDPPFGRLDKRALLPEPELPLEHMGFPTSPDFTMEPFPDDWDATRHPQVVAAYVRACKHVEDRLFAAPILALGQELFLDPDRFVIEGDQIHVLSSVALGPVHFAGAVFYSPEDFITIDKRFTELLAIVPPIHFHVGERLLHLSLDLFRNDWMVSSVEMPLLTPRIDDDTDVEPDTDTFGSATNLRPQR